MKNCVQYKCVSRSSLLSFQLLTEPGQKKEQRRNCMNSSESAFWEPNFFLTVFMALQDVHRARSMKNRNAPSSDMRFGSSKLQHQQYAAKLALRIVRIMRNYHRVIEVSLRGQEV